MADFYRRDRMFGDDDMMYDRRFREKRADLNQQPAGSERFTSSMEQILQRLYAPEYDRTQAQLPGAEQLLAERVRSPVDFGAFRSELEAMAQGLTSELFRPGGQVEQQGRAALDQSVAGGFGPTSGGYSRSRQNILTGARDTVSNAIAQGAIQLAPVAVQSRANEIANAFGLTQYTAGRADDLRESLFGARSSIEQLGLAKEQMRQNQLVLEAALGDRARRNGWQGRVSGALGGALSGAAAGSAIPGIGTVVGGILGGLGGLFG